MPVTDGQKLLVPPEYLRHLVHLANQKMQINWARKERFLDLFRSQFLADASPAEPPSAAKQGRQLQPGATGYTKAGQPEQSTDTGSAASAGAKDAKTVCTGAGAAQTKQHVQRLASLHERQTAILSRLEQLERRSNETSAPASADGPSWRPAPLYTYVRSFGSLHSPPHPDFMLFSISA